MRKLFPVFAVCALLAGCGTKKEEEAEAEAPAPVQVETVRRGPIDHVITADAVLYPVNQANVTSKISSPVRRVLVNRGDHVRAGQLLAELETADLQAAANESRSQYAQAQSSFQSVTGATLIEDKAKAQADVSSAQTSLDAARKVYESRVELQKQGALAQRLVDDAKVTMVQAQSTYDTAKRHLDVMSSVGQREQTNLAQAQVEAAKAHLENSTVQLSYGRITSPMSGIVSDRPVYPGEMAAPGTPLISIVDISQVVARANVPVKEAAAIKVGSPATITGPDGDIAGKVTVVSPAVDPSSTTVEVWVQAPNAGEKLRSGGTVRVAIKAATLQNVLIAPATALLNSPEGGQIVMVITKAPPEKKAEPKAGEKAGEKKEEDPGVPGIAHERKVSVGVRQGNNVEILSGVNEGDQVVTVGGLGLEDKAKVVIKEAPAEEDEE